MVEWQVLFSRVAFTGASSLYATATGCICTFGHAEMFWSHVFGMGQMHEMLLSVLRRGSLIPFVLSYPYRQLETLKVYFAGKDAKEHFKRRTDFFFSYRLTQNIYVHMSK